MNWLKEPATQTQLERLSQISAAIKDVLFTFDDMLDMVDTDKREDFKTALYRCVYLSPTKGDAGVVIGVVKKLLGDLYDELIKNKEVE
jgi:hypothetical protein